MQEVCLKNCDQDAAGQKLENLSKGGMVWEQTVYSVQERLPAMLHASCQGSQTGYTPRKQQRIHQ